jgi:methylenetetrahydrofolate reductase (NADPH)
LKVIEHYERATTPLISYEIDPPQRGGSIDGAFALVEALLPFNPPFIDVTSRAAQATYEELPGNVMRRRIKRKRPGTIGLCAAIQYRYGVDAVPHLLCRGFTREETEDALIELHYLGIRNVLAIRGDDVAHPKPERPDRTVNSYANELVSQIANMNQGRLLEDVSSARPTEFSIGVAGYPEKHAEAPNFAWDIANLKNKVEAGADYIVTQMFFDNAHYFRFIELCREAGITVPIVPGLKVLATMSQLHSLPRVFGAEIPAPLAEKASQAESNAEVADVGVSWARDQAVELLERGVPGVHFYVMSTAAHVVRVVKELQ